MDNNTKQTKSAGGVVIGSDGRILVVSQQRGSSWSLPKGHIEEGEDAIIAAKREIYEESGINELEFMRKLGEYSRYKNAKIGGDDTSELKTINVFLFKTNQTALKPIDVTNPEARWVDRERVADLLTHRKDKEFFISIINSI